MTELSFVVFSQSRDFATSARAALEGGGRVRVAAVVAESDGLAEALRQHRPEALLADLGPGGGALDRLAPDAVLDLLAGLPAPVPRLLLCGPEDDSALVLRAMRQGAREFLPADPAPELVRDAVARLTMAASPSRPAAPRAPVIAILGAKGGAGTTVVACQLAVALQRLGARTALVDLGLPAGDVAVHMNVQTRFTLADAVRDGDPLDGEAIRTLLHEHPSGVGILAAPARVEESELIAPVHVESVLRHLRESFDWVVVDLGRSWNDCSLSVVDAASRILVVTTPDVPTLSHARQRLEGLERLGHGSDRVRLVVNRFASGAAIGAREIERFVGRAPDLRIPNEYAVVERILTTGEPLAENEPLAVAFAELAREAHGWFGMEVPPTGRPAGLVSRVRRMLGRRLAGAA